MRLLVLVLVFLFTKTFFFFNDTATTEIYTLSLHDALPIYAPRAAAVGDPGRATQPHPAAPRPLRRRVRGAPGPDGPRPGRHPHHRLHPTGRARLRPPRRQRDHPGRSRPPRPQRPRPRLRTRLGRPGPGQHRPGPPAGRPRTRPDPARRRHRPAPRRTRRTPRPDQPRTHLTEIGRASCRERV